jgi:hypothetical protein
MAASLSSRFTMGNKPAISIECGAGCTPRSVWTLLEKRSCLSLLPSEPQFLGCPTHYVVTIRAAISLLPTFFCNTDIFLPDYTASRLGSRKFVYISHISCRFQWPCKCKAWVCGRSLAWIVGSNPAAGMDVCLLWVLCVVRKRFLPPTDHSSRGVLPSLVCLKCVWSRIPIKGGHGPKSGWSTTRKKKFTVIFSSYVVWLIINTLIPNALLVL